MTKVFEEARALPSRERARLVCKLLAADMPVLMAEEKELARREEEVRHGRIHRVEVAETMRKARALAGVGGEPPALKSSRR